MNPKRSLQTKRLAGVRKELLAPGCNQRTTDVVIHLAGQIGCCDSW
jgi:hypothetical protein